METRIPLVPLLFLLSSCGETDPDPGSAIEGSYVAANPYGSGLGFYMGFSLNTIGETVSGQGWLGGAGDLPVPLTIVGQFADPDFAIGLSSGSEAMGTITGVASGNGTLTGTYQLPGSGQSVTIVFTVQDSGAVGRYTGNVTGEFTGSFSAAAGFGASLGNFFFRLGFPNRSDVVLQLGREGGRPPVGSHALGESAYLSGDVFMGTEPNRRRFRVKSGEMRVDISTPYALIGELLLQAEEDVTLAGVGLSIQYSAACTSKVCE